MTRWVTAACLALALAASAAAQTPEIESILQRGHGAAAEDRHRDAIAAYEAALAQDPALRPALAARLGRQYLWAGDTARAVRLLSEYVAAHPGECDVRFDYALALSWNGDLRAARDEYRTLGPLCPGRRNRALLREAQIARWMDRPSDAAALYRRVLAEGTEAERRDARTGLAFVDLDRGYNRRAGGAFATELAQSADAALYEGAAASNLRLGDPAKAWSLIESAAAADALNPGLEDLRQELALRDRPAATPRFTLFEDADGTSFRGAEIGASLGWMRLGRVEAFAGASTLEDDDEAIDGRVAGVSIEHRFTPSVAVAGVARLHEFDPVDFSPATGELNLILTPNDRTRIDVAAARILIADNIAALQHELTGDFFSLGFDRRVTDLTTISLSVDDTQWSAGNERQRARFSIARRFEGVPRVTIEWPSLYMRYDEGFGFALFSPERYVETGPAINVYRRFARRWSAFGYARVGMQKEEDRDWENLATLRLAVERELHDAWAFGAALSWSNSNLASATGFRRTAATLTFTRRF